MIHPWLMNQIILKCVRMYVIPLNCKRNSTRITLRHVTYTYNTYIIRDSCSWIQSSTASNLSNPFQKMSSDEDFYEDSGNESPYIDEDEDEFGEGFGSEAEEPGPSGSGHGRYCQWHYVTRTFWFTLFSTVIWSLDWSLRRGKILPKLEFFP